MANLRKLALSMVGSAILILPAAPAFAEELEIVVTAKLKVPEGYEPVTKKVSIADLDLSKPADAAEMEKRVGDAVTSICAAPPKAAQWEVKDSKACSEFAWASARPQMDAALEKAHSH